MDDNNTRIALAETVETDFLSFMSSFFMRVIQQIDYVTSVT